MINNTFHTQNFLTYARQLRNEGEIKIERKKYGGCTELRATLVGTTDSVALYMGVLGHIRSSVEFIRG
jgi:hypothetical protein